MTIHGFSMQHNTTILVLTAGTWNPVISEEHPFVFKLGWDEVSKAFIMLHSKLKYTEQKFMYFFHFLISENQNLQIQIVF